jgi:hypothetical protein
MSKATDDHFGEKLRGQVRWVFGELAGEAVPAVPRHIEGDHHE